MYVVNFHHPMRDLLLETGIDGEKEEPIKHSTSVYTDIPHLLFAEFLLQWALFGLSTLKIIGKIKKGSIVNIFVVVVVASQCWILRTTLPVLLAHEHRWSWVSPQRLEWSMWFRLKPIKVFFEPMVINSEIDLLSSGANKMQWNLNRDFQGNVT